MADVCAHMHARVPRSHEDLEQDAFSLIDAVEADAADVAVEPVIACDFENSSIHLRFCVEGATSAEVHQKISRVAGLIEDAAAGSRVVTSMAPSSRAELAGVC